ncbi:MAG: pyridoxal-phosphate dependent enzyme [Conexibacter sp.]
MATLPRTSLASLPTPLEPCPRLSERLGRELWMKREDLTGLALGGNKARQFEYLLGEALEQGCDTVVAGQFAAQSNYCRQLAAACAKLGLRCRLVLRAVRPSDFELQGNVMLDVLLGSDVSIHEVGAEAQVELVAQAVAEETAAGRAVYQPEAFTYLAAVAYVAAGLELFEQLEQRGLEPDALYVAAAGETHAGLLVAAKQLGVATRIVGIDPGVTWWDVPARIVDSAQRTIERLQLPLSVELDDVICHDEFAAPGYGLVSAASREALELAARCEGILLDPVYTSKVLAALLQHCATGAVAGDGPLVFMHTGGLPALFSYREALGLPATLERG